MNKKQVLELHKKMYNFWQGKNGKWYSYLPKEGVEKPKGKQIESVSEEKLGKKILDYYIEIEKENVKQENICPTFLEVYFMWRTLKDLELDDNSICKYNTDCKRFFENTDFAEMPINQINENTIRLFVLETVKDLKLCKKACGKFYGYRQMEQQKQLLQVCWDILPKLTRSIIPMTLQILGKRKRLSKIEMLNSDI